MWTAQCTTVPLGQLRKSASPRKKATGTGQKWCSTTNVCYRIVRGLLDIVRGLILTLTYRGYPAKKGPTLHAYAWQIRPFWQDTLDLVPPAVRQTVGWFHSIGGQCTMSPWVDYKVSSTRWKYVAKKRLFTVLPPCAWNLTSILKRW